jgi:hypothetical protein
VRVDPLAVELERAALAPAQEEEPEDGGPAEEDEVVPPDGRRSPAEQPDGGLRGEDEGGRQREGEQDRPQAALLREEEERERGERAQQGRGGEGVEGRDQGPDEEPEGDEEGRAAAEGERPGPRPPPELALVVRLLAEGEFHAAQFIGRRQPGGVDLRRRARLVDDRVAFNRPAGAVRAVLPLKRRGLGRGH